GSDPGAHLPLDPALVLRVGRPRRPGRDGHRPRVRSPPGGPELPAAAGRRALARGVRGALAERLTGPTRATSARRSGRGRPAGPAAPAPDGRGRGRRGAGAPPAPPRPCGRFPAPPPTPPRPPPPRAPPPPPP